MDVAHTVTTDAPPRTRSPLAIAWIGLIGAWVLAGALFKLFLGTPADLPGVVRDFPLELGLVYKLAITVELAVGLLALLKPRWGWLPALLLLLVFDVVLTTQIAAGDASCGCFGGSITVPPWAMLAIDSVLLLGLVATRPWSAFGPGAPPLVAAGALAVTLVLPWLFDRQVKQDALTLDGRQPKERAWIELDVEDWVGKDIWDTPLGQPPLSGYVDVTQLPLDGLWVFWRSTCDHCAAHLKHLAETETGATLITLVRLEEPADSESNRVVHELPSGNFVQQALLPPIVNYVMETPAELRLEGGKVVAAREGVTPETGLAGSN